MCLSNTNPTPASCPGAWESLPAAPNPIWTLTPGEGLKTIYAWFKDAAGNTNTSPFSTTVTLDQTGPLNGTASATPATEKVTLNWSSFSDALSGISNYKIMYDITSTPSDCNAGVMIYLSNGTSFVHSQLTNGTTYYYRVCAVDNAGNLSLGVPVSATPHADVILIVSGMTSGDYPSIQAAYNAAHEQGDVIKARAVELSGNIVFDQPYVIELSGGYDPAYASNPFFTAVNGSLTISAGKVTIEKVVIL
jgi:hypothetical protein